MSKRINLPAENCSDSIERLQVEQRRHRRIPTSLNVEVTWVDGFGFERAAAAVVKIYQRAASALNCARTDPSVHDSRLPPERIACVVSFVMSGRGEMRSISAWKYCSRSMKSPRRRNRWKA